MRLTLLQLDVAASFHLCNPAIVDGPGGLWNGQGPGSAPLRGAHPSVPASPSALRLADENSLKV